MTPTAVEKRIGQLDGRFRTLLHLALGLGLLGALCFMAQTVLLAEVVDRVFLKGASLEDVWPLLGAMLLLLLLHAAASGAQELPAQRAATRIKGTLRHQLTAHLFHLGPAYTHRQRSGELTNTAVAGIETLDAYVTQYLPARRLAMVVPLLVFLLVLLIDPWTSLVLLFAGPMLILLLTVIGGRTRALTQRRFADLSWMSAHFLDMLQGLPTLKRYGRSREQAVSIRAISEEFSATTMDVLRTAFQMSLVMEWSATAATALVALEVSLRMMGGIMPFNEGLAVLLLTPEFFLPLRNLSLRYHAGSEGKAAAERLFAVLDTAPDPTAGHSANGRSPSPNGHPPVQGEIAFHNVSVAYSDGQRRALQDFTLSLAPGKTVALVGATGAGKTTVANLLLRFTTPTAGAVTVDGRPLQQIDPALWRAQLAWVPQSPHLFHGTIADNIRLGNPAAGDAAVTAAARAAHAHDFIQALPRGYATPVGEQGARLSGGQRQRIAIARAFLKDAPILILDEATAHLDTRNETLIREALTHLMHGRTVLIIAHRLRLAYGADQIVVLADGRIVETGRHAELMAAGGRYRELVATYEVNLPPPAAGTAAKEPAA